MKSLVCLSPFYAYLGFHCFIRIHTPASAEATEGSWGSYHSMHGGRFESVVLLETDGPWGGVSAERQD